ncbi:cytochrome P450 monooxygenase [Fomitopsis serialis]|uniref:cytochrome P450 monooxygenase n=1 Tax=Fomitopsis serialis TaxID=139415 RepID=UPI00200885B7|nr:cytochrome P450 monooxygenase [Neoantrodia serialis]KAH9928315.1 cytochrome P450 monooxygenase [Neoantrodia serialis]
MTVVNLIIQSSLVVVAIHIVWRISRRIFARTPLDNIPGPPPAPFLTGHLPQYFDRHGTEFQRRVAHNYGPVVKMQGMFGQPLLYIYDPRALHTMLIKEASDYDEEELFVRTNTLIFGPGLISVLGDQHRKQRKMLNPVFSAGHMRDMLPIFYSVTEKLRDTWLARVNDEPRELDVLNWMGRAALELIAQGGIGTSLDPLVNDTPDAYTGALKALVPTLYGLGLLRYALLLPYICEVGPVWFRRWLVNMIPHKRLQEMKYIVDISARKSVAIYEAKKEALQHGEEETSRQVAEGKDIFSILMRANMAASEADRLPEDEVIAQITTMLFAAMDTTSNSTSMVLERLAQHPDIEDKLRKEVTEAQSAGRLSYDELMRLPLLDAIVRETFRVDPLANMITRQPIKDVVLPLSEPIQGLDGKTIHEISIPKGTPIIIGVLGCNTDKALWGEDALVWKPERWLSPLPSAVTDAPIPGVYSNMMTFLGGGRSCIGFKFAELEMKVILSVLLSTFKFELTDKPVVWNVASVRYPTVGTGSNYAEMPMKVSLA